MKRREILFKAIRKDNKEWVKGSVVDVGKVYIVCGVTEWYEVYPETVCQYIGKTDVNGNMIWEHDRIRFEDAGEEGYETKQQYEYLNCATVVFEEREWSLSDFADENSAIYEEVCRGEITEDFWENAEVIGNDYGDNDYLAYIDELTPTIRPVMAENLSGYNWYMYSDGSGSIVSPDKTHYFSYDKQPYSSAGWIEYKAESGKGWSIYYDSFESFQKYAEERLSEMIVEK